MDLDSKVDYGEDNENMEEDLPPLFMQVTLTIKEGRKFIKSFSIKSLPTCLFDLAQVRIFFSSSALDSFFDQSLHRF